MKRYFLISCFLLLTTFTYAQQWDWAKNINYYFKDIGKSIGTDAQGNIYVTGSSIYTTGGGGGGGYPMFWKFDNSGNLLWADTTTGGKSVTDSAGNTYMMGNKYNSAGQRMWQTNINSPGSDIALHSLGGIILMGNILISDTTKGVLSYFDENGNLAWRSIGEFPSGGTSVACDNNGNSYVVGTGYMDSTGNSGFLVKYNSSGVLVSRKTIPDQPIDIAIASDLSIYVLGHFSSDPIFINNLSYQYNNNTLYFIKYDQQGTVLWYKIITGTIDGSAIAIDKNNDAYVTGYYKYLNIDSLSLNSSHGDLFVTKINSNGDVLWIEHSLTTNNSLGSAYINNVIVNPANEILITGAINGTVSFDSFTLTQNSMYTDMLIAKITQPSVVTKVSSLSSNVAFEFQIYPSPTNGVINIKALLGKVPETYSLKISNSLGKIIYTQTLKNISGAFEREIDLSSYSKGIYFVELQPLVNSKSHTREIRKIVLQ